MNKKLGAIIAALILIYLAQPYYFWHGVLASKYVNLFMVAVLGGLFLLHAQEQKGKKGTDWLFLMFAVSAVLFTIFGGRNLLYLITLLPITAIPFSSDVFYQRVYKYFITFFVIMVGLSVVSYVLSLAGVVSSYRTIEPLNELKQGYYLVYPFFVQYVPSLFSRFSGPFDEPGALGTYCGILLCIQKLKLKDAKSIVLLVAGILSLSFFFYVLIGIYFVFYNIFERRSAFGSVAIIVAIIAAGVIITNNAFLNDVLGERFVFDTEAGRFSGDNRLTAESQEYYLGSMVRSGQIWTGIENKAAFKEDTAGAYGFVTVLIQYGLIAMLWYMLFFLLYGYKFKSSTWSFLLFVLVFFATIYQRPNIFHSVYVFLFVYVARSSMENAVSGELATGKKH